MSYSMTIRRSILVLYFTLLFMNYGNTVYSHLYEMPPHIIVFMADDLGWNDVSFHGSNQILTPNIDALAYNGIILNRHYVLPSSTPSRTAFFTGLYPIRMGMQGQGIQGGEPRALPLNVKILPEHLRGLGYKTNLVGKWHVGYHTPQHTPLNRGFDSFLGFYNSHVSYYDYKYTYQNMTGYDMHRGDNPAHDLRRNEYVTDVFTKEAEQIIEHHEIHQPLYLQISHLAVHAPLEAPQDQTYNNYRFRNIHESNRAKYARMVEQLDNSVKSIVYKLGEKGMLRDSLILFLTDNGAAPVGKFRNWGSNYPLRGMKYTLYEGGVRGVAVLWSPRLNRTARVCNDLMHITDWLPTLYAAAGGELKNLGEIDGKNQWYMLRDGHAGARRRLLLNIDEVSKTEGAISSRFKLIRGSVEGGFYDGYYGEADREPYESRRYNQHVNPSYTTSYTPFFTSYTTTFTSYTNNVSNSSVSKSLARYLGGPVAPPSLIVQLRREATVFCRPNVTLYQNTFTTCNTTECLFDIFNDPCETKNIVHQYPIIVRELDQYLENYGRNIVRQIVRPVDWLADPRRTNDTWEPWMTMNDMFTYSTATHVFNFAYYVHIGIIFATVTWNVFI